MSAQMLSSATPMSEIVPLLGNDMRDLEAKVSAVAVPAGGEVKQNISFVRGETQSKAVEESEAQQVIFSFKKMLTKSVCTVGIQIPDYYGIPSVGTYPVCKCFGFQIPSKNMSGIQMVLVAIGLFWYSNGCRFSDRQMVI